MLPISEYDAGWLAWIGGEERPAEDASGAWVKGFREASWEYPRADQ